MYSRLGRLGYLIHFDFESMDKLLDQEIFDFWVFAKGQSPALVRSIAQEAILEKGIEILHEFHAFPPVRVSKIQ